MTHFVNHDRSPTKPQHPGGPDLGLRKCGLLDLRTSGDDCFPDDHFLGEESATELRRNPALCDELKGKNDMLRYIDLGGEGMGGPESRVWMLDPLDGTATFMTGGQYAVCLALAEDGEQKVGV